jgi:hypothetical protein
VTGSHDPEDEEPWYGTGYDDGDAAPGDPAAEYPEQPDAGHHPAEHPDGPTDPPTQPGTSQPGTSHPSTMPAGEPATVRAETPGSAPETPRPGRWRSRRVRVGAAATLAGLVLLGGGFGAGYAVADASAPPAAAHATAASGAGTGAAKGQAARKRRAAQHRQQQEGGTAPGTGSGTVPGATAGAPTF